MTNKCLDCGAELDNDYHEYCFNCWGFNKEIEDKDKYGLFASPNSFEFRKPSYSGEHRDVAEQMIGRKLLPGEEVHHINKKNWDNKPENLVVCSSRQAHGHIGNKPHLGYRLKRLEEAHPGDGWEILQQLIGQGIEAENEKYCHNVRCGKESDPELKYCPHCDAKK